MVTFRYLYDKVGKRFIIQGENLIFASLYGNNEKKKELMSHKIFQYTLLNVVSVKHVK
jgi:hypothetical protein